MRAERNQLIAGAAEHKGSWWHDWIQWIGAQGEKMVKAKGARVPGRGKLKAIEDAPGSYVWGCRGAPRSWMAEALVT